MRSLWPMLRGTRCGDVTSMRLIVVAMNSVKRTACIGDWSRWSVRVVVKLHNSMTPIKEREWETEWWRKSWSLRRCVDSLQEADYRTSRDDERLFVHRWCTLLMDGCAHLSSGAPQRVQWRTVPNALSAAVTFSVADAAASRCQFRVRKISLTLTNKVIGLTLRWWDRPTGCG